MDIVFTRTAGIDMVLKKNSHELIWQLMHCEGVQFWLEYYKRRSLRLKLSGTNTGDI